MNRNGNAVKDRVRRILNIPAATTVCVVALSMLAAAGKHAEGSNEIVTEIVTEVAILGMADSGSGMIFILEQDGVTGWQFLASSHSVHNPAQVSSEQLVFDIDEQRRVLVPAWDDDGPVAVLYYDSMQWMVLEEMDLLQAHVLETLAYGASTASPTRTYLVRDIAQNPDVLSELLSLPRAGVHQPIGGVVEPIPVEHCQMVQIFNGDGTITTRCEGGCDEGKECNMVIEIIEVDGKRHNRLRCRCM